MPRTKADQFKHKKPTIIHELTVRLTPEEAGQILEATNGPETGPVGDVVTNWISILEEIVDDQRDTETPV